MAIDPTMATGLQQSFNRTFIAVQISLPVGTIRLIDGSGVVTFGGNTFTGSDPIGGILKSMNGLTESIATEAPRFQIGLLPPSTGAIADICAVNAQGSEVLVWFGLVNQATGAVIGEPQLRGRGTLDVCREVASDSERSVELDIASVFDRLFVAGEGSRWIKSEHQTMYPGETGLDHTDKATQFPLWGTEPPKKK